MSAHAENNDDKEVRQFRSALIRKIFQLGKEIHGAECITNDEIKQAIHEDILRWRIAKARIGPDGEKKLISIMKIGQLKEIIAEYETMLGRRRKREYPLGPNHPITLSQQRFILELCDELNWDSRRRAHFCEHVVKVFFPQTSGQARKVIEGLKAMKRKSATTEGTLPHREVEDDDG
jgi:hypothetical protein